MIENGYNIGWVLVWSGGERIVDGREIEKFVLVGIVEVLGGFEILWE